MSDDDTPDPDDAADALETAGQAVKTAAELAKAASALSEGDAAGALQSGLGAAGGATNLAGGAFGADEAEAREGLRTAGAVAGAASSLVGAGRSVAGGDIGGAAGRLGGATDASRYVVPEGEAASVLSGARQAGGAAQQAGSAAQGFAGGAGGQSHDDVELHIEVTGADEAWRVTQFSITEALNAIPSATFEAHYSGHLDVSELLHAECSFSIERRQSGQVRAFKGVILHAAVREAVDGVDVSMRVAPAAFLLGYQFDSQIFQDETVVESIESVFQEILAPLNRSVRVDDLTRTYEAREYNVQYQESHLQFILRLCEEEGIFFYFEHDDDHEVMVLADSVSALARVRDEDEGRVEYHAVPAAGDRGHEYATRLQYYQEIGTTDVIIGDYDWTNPSLVIRAEKTGRGEHEPALKVYDHTDAQIFSDYASEQYGGNTAKVQARLRAERLDLDRQRWDMSSNVVTALPGRTLTIEGHPDAALDQGYLILSSSAHGSQSHAEGLGSFSAQLEVAPTAMPYRPRRRTARPIVAGPELATVVGPPGQEIHTDEHGRVRVHMSWDRHNDATAEDASCWMRISHNWAGAGFGAFFLPRIGMEVLVSFLGGSPDRPLITGCVYNGANRANVELPLKKTQTVIRTKSSPNSEGFNEMRFEDEAGSEFINVHAEKDYNEIVEHCHTTHVKVDQSNTVDHDDTETIGNDQTLHVKHDRKKIVDNDEKTSIGRHRTEEVTGHEQLHVHEWRKTKIEENEKLVVHGDRKMVVMGRDDEEIVNGREVVITAFDNLKVQGGANRNVTVDGQYNVTVNGDHYTLVQGGSEKFTQGSKKTYIESGKEIHAKTGSSHVLMKNDGKIKLAGDTKIEHEVGACKIEMTIDTITLTAGAASIELGPSGVKISGPSVTSSAQTINEITGLLVKIN